MNREPLAEGEWYHCYNRGVDKRRIFENQKDYERFQMLLYISNSQKSVHLSNLFQNQGPTLIEVLKVERGEKLVDLGAYSLMPNHFHLLLRPVVSGGISLFMKKVSTGYSMYFNKKYERNGTLLQGKFKSRRVDSDMYFRRLLNYIHANAAELYEPKWKFGKIKNEKSLLSQLSKYPFSSLSEYLYERNGETITDSLAVLNMIERFPPLEDLIEEAKIFAREENNQGRTLI